MSKDTLNRLRNISRYEAENAHGRKQERTELRHLETDRHMKAIDTMMWCCGDPCTRDNQQPVLHQQPGGNGAFTKISGGEPRQRTACPDGLFDLTTSRNKMAVPRQVVRNRVDVIVQSNP